MNPKKTSVGAQIADFWRFIWQPRPGPRPARRYLGAGTLSDVLPQIGWLRLLAWAGMLWLVNILLLAPLAFTAAQAMGAQHRIDLYNLPWFTALIWAPIVEELCFRFCLRRVALIWWWLPLMVALLISGPGPISSMFLCVALLLAIAPAWYGRGHRLQGLWRLKFATLRRVRRAYPYLFHASALVFAAVHLFNFSLGQISLALLPMLVLPQWLTGMVLGWLRVRYGIICAMQLHAVFNAGPLLMVGAIMHLTQA